MSRTLATNSGSVDSLKVPRRCGCNPKARQIRPTLEVEMPACRAMLRLLQCVAPDGRLPQCLYNDAFDLGIGDFAGHPRPRLVEQPVKAALEKAPTPLP